jgi:hypothetical protein
MKFIRVAMLSGVVGLSLCLVVFSLSRSPSATSTTEAITPVVNKNPKRPPDPSDAFFDQGEIPSLKLEISPASCEKLRGDPRNYVRATLHENGKNTYKQVGVKLKGAAGSFRGVDDRPALTINLDKFEKGQKFHGLEKFHLNNSVQDETYTHEFIGTALAAQAGVPAPRVTHARVWINDRDLGFYVLKESFDKPFLSRYFEKTNGNLYDSGFLQEIDGPLQKDSGDGDDNRDDLRKLCQACREPDLGKRKTQLEEVLAIDDFISFLAVEILTCHWDGYARNRNNYRIYFEPTTNKAYFFPHGMDQLFNDPNAGVFDMPGALAAASVLQVPEFRAKYHQRVKELTPFFAQPEAFALKLDALRNRLNPVLTAIHPDRAKQNAERVQDMKNRLVARGVSLQQQLANNPEPLAFDKDGVMKLVDFVPGAASGDAKLEHINSPDGRLSYSVLCGNAGNYNASWRRKVQLPPGHFKLEANVKTQDIAPLEDAKGNGVGLRISGANRTNQLSGTTNWTKLEFDIPNNANAAEVELVLEVRASKGQAWFEKESLRVVKIP